MMPDTGRSGALDWKGHLLLLHSAESERVSALVTWIHRGLDNNEKVIFTETRGSRPNVPRRAHCSYPIWQVDTSAAAENR
jgi:hypothetical protein